MNVFGFMRTRVFYLVVLATFCTGAGHAQDDVEVKSNYQKSEQMITMHARWSEALHLDIRSQRHFQEVSDHATSHSLQRGSVWSGSL